MVIYVSFDSNDDNELTLIIDIGNILIENNQYNILNKIELIEFSHGEKKTNEFDVSNNTFSELDLINVTVPIYNDYYYAFKIRYHKYNFSNNIVINDLIPTNNHIQLSPIVGPLIIEYQLNNSKKFTITLSISNRGGSTDNARIKFYDIFINSTQQNDSGFINTKNHSIIYTSSSNVKTLNISANVGGIGTLYNSKSINISDLYGNPYVNRPAIPSKSGDNIISSFSGMRATSTNYVYHGEISYTYKLLRDGIVIHTSDSIIEKIDNGLINNHQLTFSEEIHKKQNGRYSVELFLTTTYGTYDSYDDEDDSNVSEELIYATPPGSAFINQFYPRNASSWYLNITLPTFYGDPVYDTMLIEIYEDDILKDTIVSYNVVSTIWLSYSTIRAQISYKVNVRLYNFNVYNSSITSTYSNSSNNNDKVYLINKPNISSHYNSNFLYTLTHSAPEQGVQILLHEDFLSEIVGDPLYDTNANTIVINLLHSRTYNIKIATYHMSTPNDEDPFIIASDIYPITTLNLTAPVFHFVDIQSNNFIIQYGEAEIGFEINVDVTSMGISDSIITHETDRYGKFYRVNFGNKLLPKTSYNIRLYKSLLNDASNPIIYSNFRQVKTLGTLPEITNVEWSNKEKNRKIYVTYNLNLEETFQVVDLSKQFLIKLRVDNKVVYIEITNITGIELGTAYGLVRNSTYTFKTHNGFQPSHNADVYLNSFDGKIKDVEIHRYVEDMILYSNTYNFS